MFKLNDLFYYRVPYFIWDIMTYISSIYVVSNKTGELYFLTVFSIYGLSNIFFDINTISLHYISDWGKTHYKYHIFLSNIQSDNIVIHNLPPILSSVINNNNTDKFTVDIHFYEGGNKIIRNILLIIYLFGITRKNFTTAEIVNGEINGHLKILPMFKNFNAV